MSPSQKPKRGFVKRIRNWEYGNGKFDSFRPKNFSEFRSTQKKARRWVYVCAGVVAVSVGVVAWEVGTGTSGGGGLEMPEVVAGSSGGSGSNGGEAVGGASDGGGGEAANVPTLTDSTGVTVQDTRQNTGGLDSDVPTDPQTYTLPSGESVTGEYSPESYDESLTVSNLITEKYGVPFEFYPRIAENLYATADGHAFQAQNPESNTLDDNFYLLQGIGSQSDMQTWYDDLGWPLYASVNYHDVMIPYGTDFHDVSALTRATSGDVTIVVPDGTDPSQSANDFARYITQGIAWSLGGTEDQLGSAGDLSQPLNLTIIIAANDDFLANGDLPTLTSDNAQSVMGGSYGSSISFKVNPDGTVQQV